MYKHLFKNFQRVKPSASRSKSSEIYYLGRGYKLNENYFKLKKITELLVDFIVNHSHKMNLCKHLQIKSLRN